MIFGTTNPKPINLDMKTIEKDLQHLFERDLNTLIENIETTPDDIL